MRVTLTILAIVLCLFLIQASARFGMSRIFSRYALATNSTEAADAAVALNASDSEAHRARATIFNRLSNSEEAAKSFERAVSLRYHDDHLWIELGNRREEAGDLRGALAALDQAVRWAPHYAHTHWQRGNLLLRMGQLDEAFAALRLAASASPRYAPNVIDLAWGISNERLKTTEELLDIKDDKQRLALIRFLARKGKGNDVLEQIRSLAAPLSAENKNEIMRLLFEAKAFHASYVLYRPSENIREPFLFNSDFEEPFVLNDSGFDWTITSQPKTHLAIDVSEKLSGTKSLMITFDGDWTFGTPLLAQTFIIKPDTSYRVSFAFKTSDLVTGGPPLIVVNDADNNQLLGRSESFPTAARNWTRLNVDFTTLPTSQAAVLRLQRTNCDSSPCPIFGTLWLDEFSIKQTDQALTR